MQFLLAVPVVVRLCVLSWMMVPDVGVEAGIPVPEQFFLSQTRDHLKTKPKKKNHDDDNDDNDNDNDNADEYWTQRYYTYGRHFRGPGSPIFIILGGEGAIEPSTGILYPFIADHVMHTV